MNNEINNKLKTIDDEMVANIFIYALNQINNQLDILSSFINSIKNQMENDNIPIHTLDIIDDVLYKIQNDYRKKSAEIDDSITSIVCLINELKGKIK